MADSYQKKINTHLKICWLSFCSQVVAVPQHIASSLLGIFRKGVIHRTGLQEALLQKFRLDQSNTGKNTALPGSAEILGLRKVLVQAETLRRSGKLDEAEKLCRKLLAHNPTYMGALQTFGLVSMERKNFPQAITCFLTAAAEAPNDPTNYLNLAAAWIGLEKPAMAETMLEKALQLDSENAEIHHLIGDVQVRNREYDLAMKSFAKTIEQDSGHLLSMFKLADTYVSLGFFEEAKDILLNLCEKRPDWIGVINLLHQLPSDLVNFDFEAALKKAKKQKSETSEEFENNRLFLQAAVLHRKGEYERAWPLLLRANKEIHAENTSNMKRARSLRSQELEAAKRTSVANVKDANQTVIPLFIMGPSRSGKTTLEVLLGAHPDVKRGYENQNVQHSTVRAAQTSGLINIEQLWRLPEPAFKEFSSDFRKRIREQAGTHAVLTNTSPGLIGSAAQIAKCLPEARFVFISRHEDDLVLRILMKKYKRGNYYSYNLEAARDYVRWYGTIMDMLSKQLGNRVLTITYEDMVSEPNDIVTKAIELCGLPAFSGKLPHISPDMGCSEPYRNFLQH